MTRTAYQAVKTAFAVSRVAYECRALIIALLLVWSFLIDPILGIIFGAILVTTRGKEIIVDALLGTADLPIYVHWGTGAGAAAAGSLDLSTPSAEEARVAGTASKQTTTTANDTYRVVGQMVCATSNKTITNMGVFDAGTSGNLFVIVDSVATAVEVDDAINATFNSKFVSA